MSSNFSEFFYSTIEGWCSGLQAYPGEVSKELILAIVSEQKIAFGEAIKNKVAFDMLRVASSFCKASKYIISERDILWAMSDQLPGPKDLNLDDSYVLAEILSGADKVYPGLVDTYNARWAKKSASKAAA